VLVLNRIKKTAARSKTGIMTLATRLNDLAVKARRIMTFIMLNRKRRMVREVSNQFEISGVAKKTFELHQFFTN